MARSPSDDGIDDDSALPNEPSSAAGALSGDDSTAGDDATAGHDKLPDADAPVSEPSPAAEAEPDPAPRAVPSQEELDRLAVDVHIRRRPRYGVFVATGMLLAGLAAFVWAVTVPQGTHVNWGASVWAASLGAVGFGALLGAGVAVFADWRSRRK